MPGSIGVRTLRSPTIDAENAHYFEEANNGRLVTRQCRECRKYHFFPRTVCPHCAGDTEWVELSGRGKIYAYTVTRAVEPDPYILAYVELAEGPIMLSNIVNCHEDNIGVGTEVKVTFFNSEDGQAIPVFTP